MIQPVRRRLLLFALCLILISLFVVPVDGSSDPLCALVASTNLEYITRHYGTGQWRCNSTGEPVTPPCAFNSAMGYYTGVWNGIGCSEDVGEVISITQYWNQELNGTLPAGLSGLTTLQSLEFGLRTATDPPNQKCLLNGTLPASYCDFPQLSLLDIRRTQMSGSLPDCFESLTSLTTLVLQQNELTGTVPTSLGQAFALTQIEMRSNRLTGTVPLQLCANTALKQMDLTDNPGLDCYADCLNTVYWLSIDVEACGNSGWVTIQFVLVFGGLVFVGILCTVARRKWFSGVHRLLQQRELRDNESSEHSDRGGGGGGGGHTISNMQGNDTMVLSREELDDFYAAMGKGGSRSPSSATQGGEDAAAAAGGGDGSRKGSKGHGEKVTGSDAENARVLYLQYRVLLFSLLKLVSVSLLVLVLESDWRYCPLPGDSPGSRGTEVIEQCACDMQSQGCVTMCNDYASSGIAELTKQCACEYWEVFQLGPMMLHVLHFAVQCACLCISGDFNPQGTQLYVIYYGSWGDIYQKLLFDAPQSSFAFVETITTIYVWMGVSVIPRIQCTSAIPLSDFYYPLFMTISEYSRLNMFAASQVAMYHDVKRRKGGANAGGGGFAGGGYSWNMIMSVAVNALSIDWLATYLLVSFTQAGILWARVWYWLLWGVWWQQCCAKKKSVVGNADGSAGTELTRPQAHNGGGDSISSGQPGACTEEGEGSRDPSSTVRNPLVV